MTLDKQNPMFWREYSRVTWKYMGEHQTEHNSIIMQSNQKE